MGRGSGAGGGGGGRGRAAGGDWSRSGFGSSALAAAKAAAAAHPDQPVERAGEALRSWATYGRDKVFIEKAWQFALDRGYKGSLATFKREALAAHLRGDLTLVRADLVEAMHPSTMRNSEIEDRGQYGTSHYHFIKLR